MLKNPASHSKPRAKEPLKKTPKKAKTSALKKKTSPETEKNLENAETRPNLSKKPPVYKKSSIILTKHSPKKKISKKRLFIQTLLPGTINSDLEKSTNRIDKDRVQSNLENSLKSKLELSQKIFKNLSPTNQIIRLSLRKGRTQKLQKEKEAKRKKLEEEIKKLEISYQNNLIRKINKQKFKSKKGSPDISTGRKKREQIISPKIRSTSANRQGKDLKRIKTTRSNSLEKEYFPVELDKTCYVCPSCRETHYEEAAQKKTKSKVNRKISLIDTNELENYLNDSDNILIEKTADLEAFIKEEKTIENFRNFIETKNQETENQLENMKKNQAARVIQKAYINYMERQREKLKNAKENKLNTIIKEQISWREAQMLSLDYLREKELEDFESLSEVLGQNPQLFELLIKTVNQRYENLTKVFKENLDSAEQEIIENMDTLEVLDFSNKIKDKKDEISKIIEINNMNSSLSKQEVESIIKEGKESLSSTLVSISCQTAEEKKLEKQKTMTKIETFNQVIGNEEGVQVDIDKTSISSLDLSNKQKEKTLEILTEVKESRVHSINISDILNLNLSASSSVSLLEDSPSGILQPLSQNKSTSPVPNRPVAPFMFFDTDENLLIDTSPDINKKHPLPVLNLSVLNTQFSGPISEPRIETSSIFVRAFISEILSKVDIEKIEFELSKGVKKDSLKELEKIRSIEFLATFQSPPLVLDTPSILTQLFDNHNQPESLASSQRYLRQADKIHKAMILAAADEVLQKFRPYGVKGVPFEWSCKNRGFFKEKLDMFAVLKMVSDEIEEYSRFEVGKIATEDMIMSNGHLDEQLLIDIREDTLGYAMKREIVENDWLWCDYEFEETQVKLDLADMVLSDLADELAELDL